MASEWEELEKLTKEELIIELVRMRTIYSILRGEMEDESITPTMDRKGIVDDEGFWSPGEVTTDDWAERIALYAMDHVDDNSFCSCDLVDYGLTDDQAYDVCKRLYAEGRMKLPDGVRLEDEY